MSRVSIRQIRAAAALALVAISIAVLPASPAAASPPVIGHFSATVSDTNLVTLDWQVNGGSPSNLLYIFDVGFRPINCANVQPVGCSTSFRVTTGGIRSYTLQVNNDALQNVTSTITVDVPDLAPPTTPTHRVVVDMLNVQPQTLTWSHPGNDGFVQIRPPGSFLTPSTHYSRTGTLPVPKTSLPIGLSTYTLSYCKQPDPSAAAICSEGTPMTFAVGPDQFTGAFRRFVPANQSLTLNWSARGTNWLLTAPSLGVTGVWLSSPNYTIPAAQVTAGVHDDITLTTCRFAEVPWRCSNRAESTAPSAGTVTFNVAPGAAVVVGATLAQLAPTAGGAPIAIKATRAGTFSPSVAAGANVIAGASVGYVLTDDVAKLQVVAGTGSTVPVWSTQSWSSAYNASSYDTTRVLGTGSPLDITVDSSGDVWSLGEFSTAIAQVHQGAVAGHEVPIGRTWTPSSGRYVPSQPFGNPLGANSASNVTALGERVIDTGSAIWFTQGGELFSTVGSGGQPLNHSRIVRFDRTGTDSPSTEYDDRLCAVHVPGDNNQVIGIDYDHATNRVYFVESHSGSGSGTSSLDWFVDDGSVPCSNTLNYQDSAAVAAASATNLCATPSQTGCIHRIDVPSSAGSLSHVTVDAASGYAWLVDFTGRVLSRYPLSGGSVESFPLPKPIGGGYFGGFPWQVRANANAVYLNEYGDNRLVRFDKSVANPTVACATLDANGANPCMSAILVPMAGPDVNVHSIALTGDKLWFTVSNESGAPATLDESTFGYVNLAAWANGTPTGVQFTGLATLGLLGPNQHHAFRGIEVGSNGKVAVADMSGEVEVLSRK